MKEKLLYTACLVAAWLLLANLAVILLVLPDEAEQGAIYRIIFFHVPAAWSAFLGFLVAALASVAYLVKRNLWFDALAVSVTEVGLAFSIVNLITGMIWGRIIWGIWWTWDARLTSMLVCALLYAGYLMLRRAVEEPAQRAKFSAVFSIFAFIDVPIVWFSIQWWRTQHPQPVIRGGGSMDPAMYKMMFANWVPLLLLFVVLSVVRLRQERARGEIDALRREAHAL
ncbi:MAG: cytochrome c biogenesis protein CcsA [Bryobacteraceae bacterium]|nr:cytochrome c biogenesis protein CcsA [Bryobacteraceae bacterium]